LVRVFALRVEEVAAFFLTVAFFLETFFLAGINYLRANTYWMSLAISVAAVVPAGLSSGYRALNRAFYRLLV
jgi:hypothetical protein